MMQCKGLEVGELLPDECQSSRPMQQTETMEFGSRMAQPRDDETDVEQQSQVFEGVSILTSRLDES